MNKTEQCVTDAIKKYGKANVEKIVDIANREAELEWQRQLFGWNYLSKYQKSL